MGILDNLKDIAGVITKVGNVDQVKLLVETQQQVYELMEENRRLKERLETRENLSFKKNSYWRGNDGPFCSSCWDGAQKLVHMHVQKGYHPKCPACGSFAPDPDDEMSVA
jgi:hypothetical protein